jgi:hypothetical protein
MRMRIRDTFLTWIWNPEFGMGKKSATRPSAIYYLTKGAELGGIEQVPHILDDILAEPCSPPPPPPAIT